MLGLIEAGMTIHHAVPSVAETAQDAASREVELPRRANGSPGWRARFLMALDTYADVCPFV